MAYNVTENLFDRLVLDGFKEWADSRTRKPLVVRGARQVGKTSAVRLFSRGYRRYAELNLEKESHARLFQSRLSLSEIIQAIQLECSVPPGPEPLLLFLDEIQEVPEAVAMLRFFYEERPDIQVIAAGSLLELALDAASISFPVGRVQYLYMRPLSFQEFLGVMGEEAALAAWKTIPAPLHAHAKLLELFHSYALIGGMPESVTRFRDAHGDVTEVNQVYADMFTTFRDDILKYGRNETMRRILLHALDSAPYESGSRITFHGFGGSAYRSREMGEALRTLEKVMLLELVYPTVQCGDPAMPDRKKSPRLQFLDVGLVNHRAGLQRQLIGVQDLADVYRGRLIEQLIGQEFKTMELRTDAPLVFWVRDKAQSQAEVDFLIHTGRGIVPVEAKSGEAGRLRSLHQYMARSQGSHAVRLYAGPYSVQSVPGEASPYTLLNIPYYAAAHVHRYMTAIGT